MQNIEKIINFRETKEPNLNSLKDNSVTIQHRDKKKKKMVFKLNKEKGTGLVNDNTIL